MKIEKPLTTTLPKHERVQQQQQQLQSQNRKTTVWSREKITQLIELYKKQECLWNHWHEAYKNKDKRNRAIEYICKTLNVPKFEFGKKIHNLRNQFNTEMKKLEQRMEEAGASLDETTNNTELRCKWSYFEPLMFLRPVIEPRPGGYQANFQPSKKMRVNFDFTSSEDDINVTTVVASSNGSSNTTNPEDLPQFQYEDNGNEEIITDDFQSFESEIAEDNQPNGGGEVSDRKYYSPQESSSSSCIKSTPKNKKSSNLQQSSQADIINANGDPAAAELNLNTVTAIPSQSQISTTLPSPATITTSEIAVPSLSHSASRPTSMLHDQWDAFGEIVANEFRNLNSELSRKRLKRKIMQAMLEVGEEDDNLQESQLKSN